MERELYAGLVGDLASHGNVVVAIDHPHDASIVEFPDGHVVMPSSQMDITAALSVRVADTRFVLSALARFDDGALLVHSFTRRTACCGKPQQGAKSVEAMPHTRRV